MPYFTVVAHGFSLVADALPDPALSDLIAAIGATTGPGTRSMLGVPKVARLARSDSILNLLRPHLIGEPRPVRGIFFNKSPETNWLVAWHQDLTIAVRKRIDVAGFGPWTVKEGVPHVQPPAELLARMLTVRLHFDDADETNGALRVVPGSHRNGRLSAEQIETRRRESGETICSARAGDALLMRPLLLHASQRSTSDRPRRVLHLEYADFALPGGLEWREAA